MHLQRPLRVLIAALGSHGDVHPFIAIAKAMRDRGHNVTLIAPAVFEPLVRAAGIDFAGIGSIDELDRISNDPDLWKPSRAFFVLSRNVSLLTESYYQAVEQRHVPGRTVAVMSTLALGARVAQEKLGIPGVTIHLSPAIIRSAVDPPDLPLSPIARWQPLWMRRILFQIVDSLIIDPLMGKPLNSFRKSLGMSPARGILRDWINSPQRVIGLFPDWFCPPAPDWPKQLVLTGFPLYDERELTPISPELQQFLRTGDAPIAFTPGSAMRHGKEFFEAAVAACVGLRKRGLLLSRHSQNISADLPPGIMHIDYAPFSLLLPRCAALVHHGGIGTSAQGMAAGIPQVVMHMAHDQIDNARRLQKLGVAAVVPARNFNANKLQKALRQVLNSSEVAQACARVRSLFSGRNDLTRTVELIEKTATIKILEDGPEAPRGASQLRARS
jgi:rhamnosyltransferase subunit B